MNFFLCQKGCYKRLKANLTEPSKINEIAVLILACLKLNKDEGFRFFTLL